jgi:iron complex outermembrane receptor protein
MNLITASDSLSTDGAKVTQGQMPRNSAQVISMWDINEQWKFNGYLRYVDELPSNNIASYWTVDATLQWQISSRFSIKLSALNLGNNSHQEWDERVPVGQEVMINFRWGI